MFDHLDSAGNFTGTQAASACIYVARFAINKSFYATNVSFPGSVGTSVGVGYFDTKANTFSAEITFGHSGTSFVLSESQRSYYNKVSQKMQAFSTCFLIITKKFRKNSLVEFKHDNIDIELIGATILTKFLYERQLCGQYNSKKLNAFKDLIESTNDRLIVFYNFNEELIELKKIAEECGKGIGYINGSGRSMHAYEYYENGITFVQYQAGAMGLNLQKANKIIYFTPPVSSELFEQSKKRIHRIGQDRPCFYYYLICGNSIEQAIYGALAKRKDYTDRLFQEDSY